MKNIDIKLNEHFAGKVVRKDLTKLVKGNAIVPTYVLEYLLGQYCATDDSATIEQGVETVKNIIAKHFVYRDEAQLIKSTIREKGSHRLIDKVSVRLNDKRDYYEATFANLGLKRIPINDDIIKKHPKLLSEGVWCIATLSYLSSDEKNAVPWKIDDLKPIQISNIDIDEYKKARKYFDKNEWIDVLLQTIGLNPEEFTFRSKLLQLSRLIPYVENNYNLIELGPKGTGKSHIFSEMSPHGILISGGEVSKAKLFVNNRTGDIGLVGYWDVVAYDEFAGKNKKTDKGLVDIMKNYMANKSFSRGTEVLGASASMAFVGNTDHSVAYMMRHSNLFETLPPDYYDPAFLDRVHAYLPGWEVMKLRNEMFSDDYGFIVDYLAEILKRLRKEDRTQDYSRFFDLSDTITTRDKTSITKTFSGLVKIIYPHGDLCEDQASELMDFAIECRKRVKQQLRKMDETFDEEIDFSYKSKASDKWIVVETLEDVEYGETSSKKDQFRKQKTDKNDSKDEGMTPRPGQIIVRENQTGISYNVLFSAFLKGATEIKIIDPYIRLPYQIRNLMEFMRLIHDKKSTFSEVKVHLITNNDEHYIQDVKDAFESMTFSLEAADIAFSYELNDNIHDRSISMNNGWKIILGRGLDIWQKTGGWYDINEYVQEKRLCKGCEITYVNM